MPDHRSPKKVAKNAVDQVKTGVKQVETGIRVVRRHSWFVDHLLATIGQYRRSQGDMLAGAITYFGFLSIFPLLALAFAVVGIVDNYYDISASVEDAINSALPGMIGTGPGKISIDTLTSAGTAVGIFGLLGFLYAGLGWLGAMRQSLSNIYAIPEAQGRNYFVDKLVDLGVLLLVGVTMLVSVVWTGLVTTYSQQILESIGLRSGALVQGLLWLVTVSLGLSANTLLFLMMFKLLPRTDLPWRSLIKGALVAAIGFEVLKVLATWVIARTSDKPAFAVVGVALVLLIWINYVSRVTLYGAAWASTAPEAKDSKARRARAAALEETQDEGDVNAGRSAPA